MDNNKQQFIIPAKGARELFTDRAAALLPAISDAVLAKLLALVDTPAPARESRERRDAWLLFRKVKSGWVSSTAQAWRDAVVPTIAAASAPSRQSLKGGAFELMGDDVVENKILASRLALRILDVASWEINDLRLRVQNLEGTSDQARQDILRPEVLAQKLVEQWCLAGLTRPMWQMVQDVLHQQLGDELLMVYHATNEFLVQQGVMAEIDLRPLVRRTPSAVVTATGAGALNGRSSIRGQLESDVAQSSAGASGSASASQRGALSADGSSGTGYPAMAAGGDSSTGLDSGFGPSTFTGTMGTAFGGLGTGGVASMSGTVQRGSAGKDSSAMTGLPSSASGFTGGFTYVRGSGPEASPSKRMDPNALSPVARARQRAQGVLGHLKRLLTDPKVGYDETQPQQLSPALHAALDHAEVAEQTTQNTLQVTMLASDYGDNHLEQASSALRERTSTFKKAAGTTTEKATIEIVALMFQSILAEDRIPAVVRVWFARLQIPVLRVAMAEPEFFGSLEHPARRLIDRMGSCVLGFDATVGAGTLEHEIRRVVSVIEQYPEAGRRAFQLVYDEFLKFLSQFLTEQGNVSRVATVAQQVEQKETMVIQFTIEMRSMLNDMPVREQIREFLFKVWAEVLAMAAMKHGPQHATTLTLKRAATDLVWAASAKPNREDRARVIADLPQLLQLLRSGMSMLGMSPSDQDEHLKLISDTLADAFMSKTDAIPMERIEVMAQRLVNLEDYLSDEDLGDLPLQADHLIMMLGMDAADIQIITDGGTEPGEAVRAWARELQLGAWFSLDHSGQISHVQFVWTSERKQLHLFASTNGRSFLIQARRLAAYLQAGLIVPSEDEALTVRATRDALAKIDANPERLLS